MSGRLDESGDCCEYIDLCPQSSDVSCREQARRRAAKDETAQIDAAHIEHQRAWSTATFGPREQRGPTGPLAHIRKELDEVAEDPTVLEEWVDVIILAFDGAWRGGHEPQEIIDAVKAKQAKNEAREWPDWRGVPADQAIEHVSCGFHAWGDDGRCVTCGDLRSVLNIILCETPDGCTCGAPASTPAGMHHCDCAVHPGWCGRAGCLPCEENDKVVSSPAGGES